MVRRLVINADDLGLARGVNDGVFDAHDHGVLTSASLFATAPATADAITRIRHRPSLGVGCHLTLVDGQPTLPPERVPTLVADDGRFRHSWKPFIVACLSGRVSYREIERELTAQIDSVRGAGVTLTHLDAHKHVHAFPPIFTIVARLAARFGIPTVRVPFERTSLSALRGDRRQTRWWQVAQNLGLWPWARRNRRIAAAHALRTPQFIGRLATGLLNAGTLDALLHRLAPGVTELMVHPGYVDEDLARVNTRLRQSRADEVALLCAPGTASLIQRECLVLVRHNGAMSTNGVLHHVS